MKNFSYMSSNGRPMLILDKDYKQWICKTTGFLVWALTPAGKRKMDRNYYWANKWLEWLESEPVDTDHLIDPLTAELHSERKLI